MVVPGCECKKPETVDKPASELGVFISVPDVAEAPSDNKVPVMVQFSFDGKVVYLASNVGVFCNGTTLPNEGLFYGARVPIVSPGGNYNIVHKRGGVNTAVNITVPQRPVFTSPTGGATVARSSNLTVTYVPGTGSAVDISASGNKAGGGTTSAKAGGQPDTGTYSGLDVTAFEAGPGGLSLIRVYENIHAGGAGFASVKSTYRSGSHIDVTWQ
jgi:hypothetical protein